MPFPAGKYKKENIVPHRVQDLLFQAVVEIVSESGEGSAWRLTR